MKNVKKLRKLAFVEHLLLIKRRKTKKINLDGVSIGGDAPVVVQSMTNTDTRDVEATVAQIKGLEKAGCEIIRIALPDKKPCEAIPDIKKRIRYSFYCRYSF